MNAIPREWPHPPTRASGKRRYFRPSMPRDPRDVAYDSGANTRIGDDTYALAPFEDARTHTSTPK